MPMKQLVLYLSIAVAQAQNVTIQVNGKPVGTEQTLNLIPGAGILPSCTDNAASNRVDCMVSMNPVLLSTHDAVHSNENYCYSSNGTTAYTCALPYKTLTGYRAGMTFLLNADQTCNAACTLNIDNAGPVSIKMIDGATDPRGTVVAGQPQWIFYDGTVFRLMGVVSTRDGRGDLVARRIIGSMDMLNYAPVVTLDVTAGDMHKLTTIDGLGNATVNATTGGLAGQHMWIIIANDPASAKTITFGTNLKSSGPLSGAAGKSATIHFISDGMAWYEVARTTNL